MHGFGLPREASFVDERGRAHRSRQLDDLRAGEAIVERQADDSGARQREEHLDDFGAIGEENRDDVPLLQAEPEKCLGKTVGALIGLFEGEPAARARAVECRRVRIALSRVGEQIADGHFAQGTFHEGPFPDDDKSVR